MRSSTRNFRRELGKPFVGSSPFLTPFALPVQPILEALTLSPESIIVEIGTIACRFTQPLARYLATKSGSGMVYACDFDQTNVERTTQKAKDAHLVGLVSPQLIERVTPDETPVAEEEADIVIAISTPAFHAAPTPFLEGCLKMLRPGGQLFIAEWRDARKVLTRDDTQPELAKDTAWNILKTTGGAVCTALDIPELEWAVSIVKPVVQVSL